MLNLLGRPCGAGWVNKEFEFGCRGSNLPRKHRGDGSAAGTNSRGPLGMA